MSTLRNLLHSGIAVYIEYILGFVISVIIARALGPEEYGVYVYFIWISAILIMINKNGISTAAIKFLAESRGSVEFGDVSDVYAYIKSVQSKILVMVVLVAAVFLGYFWERIIPELEVVMIFPLLVAVYFKSAYVFLMSSAKGMNRFDKLSKVILLTDPVNVILVVIIVYAFNKVESFIFIYMVISFVYWIFMRREVASLIQRKKYAGLPPGTLARIKKHTILVSFNMMLGFIIFRQSEIVFLDYFGSKELVAYYNVGFVLASGAMELVPGVYTAILLPLIAKLAVDNKDKLAVEFRNSTRYLVILSLPVVVVGIYFSSQLISVIYGSEYMSSVKPLIFCLLAASFYVVSQVAISHQVSADKQLDLLILLVVVAIMNLSLDYVLIKSYLLDGAVVANAVSSFVYMIIVFRRSLVALNTSLQYFVYLKVFIAVSASLVPAYLLGKMGLNDVVLIMVGGSIAVIIYLFFIVRLGCLTEPDLVSVGKVGCRLLKSKYKLVKIFIDYAIRNKLYLKNA